MRSIRAPTSSCVTNSPRSSDSTPRFTASINRASFSRYKRNTSCASWFASRPLLEATFFSSASCSGVRLTSIILSLGTRSLPVNTAIRTLGVQLPFNRSMAFPALTFRFCLGRFPSRGTINLFLTSISSLARPNITLVGESSQPGPGCIIFLSPSAWSVGV